MNCCGVPDCCVPAIDEDWCRKQNEAHKYPPFKPGDVVAFKEGPQLNEVYVTEIPEPHGEQALGLVRFIAVDLNDGGVKLRDFQWDSLHPGNIVVLHRAGKEGKA